jgi:hypothetical protein
MLVFPTSALGKTVYFRYDAEGGYIQKSGSTGWTEVQSKVSLSQNVAKNGNWSLRHEVNATGSNQTGKVTKHFGYLPGGGIVSGYYSAWYYIDQGYDDNNWKNTMQWKTENAAPTTIAGGFKATVAPLVINGVRQLIVSVVACGLPMGSFPQYQKNKACEFIQINNPKPVPRNKWYHLEVFYKAAAPSVLGNQDIKQPGEIIVWQDGVEVFNISHPNFDTLRSDRKSGTLSDNKYMYWGIGNYICTCSQPPLNVLYTDDAMVRCHGDGLPCPFGIIWRSH